MSAQDVISRDALRRRLELSTAVLARELVQTHAETCPDLKISYGLCLNPDATDPWASSLELLEIGDGVPNDSDPDFHPIEFGAAASQAWPRVKIILANPHEFATPRGLEFARDLAAKLKARRALVVFGTNDPTKGWMIEPLSKALQATCRRKKTATDSELGGFVKLAALRTTPDSARLVKGIVKEHRKNVPDHEMVVAIWGNSSDHLPSPWTDGIELIEICRGLKTDPEPDFASIEFAASNCWPKLRMVLTTPEELKIDRKIKGETGYFASLLKKIKDGTARMVVPSTKDAVRLLEGLAGEKS